MERYKSHVAPQSVLRKAVQREINVRHKAVVFAESTSVNKRLLFPLYPEINSCS